MSQLRSKDVRTAMKRLRRHLNAADVDTPFERFRSRKIDAKKMDT